MNTQKFHFNKYDLKGHVGHKRSAVFLRRIINMTSKVIEGHKRSCPLTYVLMNNFLSLFLLLFAISFNSWGFLVPYSQIYLLINDTWAPFSHLTVLITAMWYPLRTYTMSTSHRNPQLFKSDKER